MELVIIRIIKNTESTSWNKEKNFLKTNPNKCRIKDFNYLLFRYIEIMNQGESDIYVRVKSRKIGSEDFMLLKPLDTQAWKRFDGEYLVELVTPNLTSKRYYLKPDNNYKLDENSLFNSTTNTKIANTQDLFGSRELIYFDTISKRYLRNQINYDDGLDEENVNEPEENFEYYENKKPKYVKGNAFTDGDFPT